MQPVANMKPLLVVILVLALGGLTFSGYLSYHELYGAPGTPTCPAVGEPGTVLGAPPCIYGFVMYLAIVALAIVALTRRRATR
jgi:uncharacterized membrane protein